MEYQRDFAVGSLRIRLIIRGARSLKDKRSVVRSVKDRLRGKFNASVAEVADLDIPQSAVLAVAVVANDPEFVRAALAQIANFVRFTRDAELAACDMEIL